MGTNTQASASSTYVACRTEVGEGPLTCPGNPHKPPEPRTTAAYRLHCPVLWHGDKCPGPPPLTAQHPLGCWLPAPITGSCPRPPVGSAYPWDSRSIQSQPQPGLQQRLSLPVQ